MGLITLFAISTLNSVQQSGFPSCELKVQPGFSCSYFVKMKAERIDIDTNQRSLSEHSWISDVTFGARNGNEIEVRSNNKNTADNTVKSQIVKENLKGRPIVKFYHRDNGSPIEKVIRIPIIGYWRPESVKQVGQSFSINAKGFSFSTKAIVGESNEQEIKFNVPNLKVNYRVIAIEPSQVTIESEYTIRLGVNADKEDLAMVFNDVRTTSFRTSDGVVVSESQRIEGGFESKKRDYKEKFIKISLEKSLKI